MAVHRGKGCCVRVVCRSEMFYSENVSNWHCANFVISKPHVKVLKNKNVCHETQKGAKLLSFVCLFDWLLACFSVMNATQLKKKHVACPRYDKVWTVPIYKICFRIAHISEWHTMPIFRMPHVLERHPTRFFLPHTSWGHQYTYSSA